MKVVREERQAVEKGEGTDVKRIDGRCYPTRFVFKDELNKVKGTEYIIDTIEFNVAIPAIPLARVLKSDHNWRGTCWF